MQQMVRNLTPQYFAQESGVAGAAAQRMPELQWIDFTEMQMRRQPGRSGYCWHVTSPTVVGAACVEKTLQSCLGACFSGLPGRLHCPVPADLGQQPEASQWLALRPAGGCMERAGHRQQRSW